MKIIISPAKNLDFTTKSPMLEQTDISYPDLSALLIDELKKLTVSDIQKLMDVNPKIAELNKERYSKWKFPFNEQDSKQAIFAFNGEVYNGLKANTLSADDVKYAQQHLRILSGLYGILRPLDLIMPYRLEMGIKLETSNSKNLYEFWGDIIKDSLQNELDSDDGVLINLASAEYYKSIKADKLKAKIITPIFKDFRKGELKQIVIYAKKARGMMTRYIIQNRCSDVEQLKEFSEEGYIFDENLSNENDWVFTR